MIHVKKSFQLKNTYKNTENVKGLVIFPRLFILILDDKNGQNFGRSPRSASFRLAWLEKPLIILEIQRTLLFNCEKPWSRLTVEMSTFLLGVGLWEVDCTRREDYIMLQERSLCDDVPLILIKSQCKHCSSGKNKVHLHWRL